MAGYGSDGGFTSWASASGFTVPAGSIPEARQRGSDYIDSTYGAQFPGQPADGIDQERAWPRSDALDKFGNEIADTTIPSRVIFASYHAALAELRSPGSLSVSVRADKRVKREKVDGAVEREFFDPGKDTVADAVPRLTAVEGLLEPLLISASLIPAVLVV